MSDTWLDLLRLCVMGAVGLGGAWLGAQATRRRERWSHRREVYQPILLSLMDLYIHSRHRLRLEEESDSADPKSQVRLHETIDSPRVLQVLLGHDRVPVVDGLGLVADKRHGCTPTDPGALQIPDRRPSEVMGDPPGGACDGAGGEPAPPEVVASRPGQPVLW